MKKNHPHKCQWNQESMNLTHGFKWFHSTSILKLYFSGLITATFVNYLIETKIKNFGHVVFFSVTWGSILKDPPPLSSTINASQYNVFHNENMLQMRKGDDPY